MKVLRGAARLIRFSNAPPVRSIGYEAVSHFAVDQKQSPNQGDGTSARRLQRSWEIEGSVSEFGASNSLLCVVIYAVMAVEPRAIVVPDSSLSRIPGYISMP